MNHDRARTLGIATALVLGVGCQPDLECGPSSSCVASQVFVDTCRRDPKVLNNVSLGGTADCELDFGTLIDQRELKIVLTNPSNLTVHLQIILESPIGPPVAAFFLVEEPPIIIEPGLSIDLSVRAVPIAEGAISTVLNVTSDASNLPESAEGNIPIDLLAQVISP